MVHPYGSDGQSDQPMIYHIRIKGHLGRQWTAALYGILRKIRDLGMVLLAVNFVGFSPPDSSADL